MSGFANFGEIRAWRCFGNFGCENIARLQFPQNCQNLSNYGPALLIDARILGILGKLEPGHVLALLSSQILVKFEAGDVLATSDAKTLPGSNFPRFVKPEMQK